MPEKKNTAYSIVVLERELDQAIKEYVRVLYIEISGGYNKKHQKSFNEEKDQDLLKINEKIVHLKQAISMLKDIYGGNVQDPDQK